MSDKHVHAFTTSPKLIYHVNFESQVSGSFRKTTNNIKAYFDNRSVSEELSEY